MKTTVGVMAGDEKFAAEDGSAPLEFAQMDGELDAAIVFAAAAEDQYQNGKAESAATCLSDATDGYIKVLEALANANLTGAQLHDLKAKLIRLQHLLGGLRTPVRNEAA